MSCGAAIFASLLAVLFWTLWRAWSEKSAAITIYSDDAPRDMCRSCFFRHPAWIAHSLEHGDTCDRCSGRPELRQHRYSPETGLYDGDAP